MENKEGKIVEPVYRQIAVDIANKIVNGKYKEGDKIKGRSTLSTQYKVSPETIRRSMSMLEDMNIVTVRPNVGIEVVSQQRAVEFVDKFRGMETVTNIKNNIFELISSINKQNSELSENIKMFVDSTERYRSVNPFMPFELEVTSDVSCLGKSISEVNFWHNTGATIIGIKRQDIIILSPGPYVDFKLGDIVVIVGDEETLMRTRRFFYGK